MSVLETSWQGEAITDLKTHTLLQTRKNTRRREFGVGCIVDTRCKENILGFQPISERICTLRIERKFINITFINIHAPMEDKEEEERENVYVQLWIWIQAMMSKSSWGAQMPKSDKKEILHNYRATQFAKHI